jgi:hypothetical protein
MLLLPRMQVLFASGCTQNAIIHGGRIDTGVELLSKPCSREQLARKVRQMLDGADAARAAQPPPLTQPLVERMASHAPLHAVDKRVIGCVHLALAKPEQMDVDIDEPFLRRQAP